MNKLNWIKAIYNQFFQLFRKGKEEISRSPFSDPPTPSAMHLSTETWIKQYEGKLLLRQEIDLPESIFQHYTKLQYFHAVPSIMKKFFSIQCRRCFNQDKAHFSVLPCKRCQKSHLYCRHCIEMGRVLDCEPLYEWKGPAYVWPEHKTPCSWQGHLTNAQKKAAQKIALAIEKQRKLLVWAVTGSGKTEMLFSGIEQALQAGKRICIASPRADVVRELVPRVQAAFLNVSVQGLHANSRDKTGTAQLIIATTHQLYRYYNAFDVLIIDEIDAFPYHADDTLKKAADRAGRTHHRAVIYLTATPRDKQKWQMFNKTLPYTFVPTRYHGAPLVIPQWKMQPSLVKKISKDMVPPFMSQWFLNRPPHRQVLLFIPTLSLLSISFSVFKAFLLKEKIITSADQIAQVHAQDASREEKIEAFRRREITVLLTTTILERGVTFPSIDVLVLDSSHPVFDEAALTQIAGRAGRSASDPKGQVLFFYQTKTKAMVRTNQSIREMNRLQKLLLQKGEL